jgi:hypothetical protein
MLRQCEKNYPQFKYVGEFEGSIIDTKNETRGRILGRNWDKGLEFSSLLLTITSTNGILLRLSESGLKLVCNVNIV